MDKIITVETIIDAFKKGDYEALRPTGKRFGKNHIFDKTQSIIWNEEEVERKNKEFKEAFDKYRAERNRLQEKLADDLAEAMSLHSKLNKRQIRVIIDYAWRDQSSSGILDVVGTAEYLQEMVEKIIAIG